MKIPFVKTKVINVSKEPSNPFPEQALDISAMTDDLLPLADKGFDIGRGNRQFLDIPSKGYISLDCPLGRGIYGELIVDNNVLQIWHVSDYRYEIPLEDWKAEKPNVILWLKAICKISGHHSFHNPYGSM